MDLIHELVFVDRLNANQVMMNMDVNVIYEASVIRIVDDSILLRYDNEMM